MSKRRKGKVEPTYVIEDVEGPIREEYRVPVVPEARHVIEDATGTIIIEADIVDADPSASAAEAIHRGRWFVGPVLLGCVTVLLVLAVGTLLDKVSLEVWKFGASAVITIAVALMLVSGVGAKLVEAAVRGLVGRK